MMNQEISLILEAVLCGLCFMAACALWTRSRPEAAHRPIALLFSLATVLTALNIIETMMPTFETTGSALSFGLVMFFWPLFWFYIEGITAETPWSFGRRHAVHLVPGVICLVVASIALAHEPTRTVVFGGARLEPFNAFILTVALFVFVLSLAWFVQTGAYFLVGMMRLFRYRARLKDIFASTEGSEMTWLVALATALPTFWILSSLDLFEVWGSFMLTLESVINIGLMLILALWAFRQKPGFSQIYDAALPIEPDPYGDVPTDSDNKIVDPSPANTHTQKPGKYRHSSLTAERATQIAQRLNAVMAAERLFLDPNLSFPKLSAHLNVSSNLLSQTLNETVGLSFFDYVNGLRVKEAISLLEKRDSTILTIALASGFNSKSAFYKSFKRATGMTPKQHNARRSNAHTPTAKSI